MMTLLVLASVLLASAFAATDPTTICLPAQLQSDVYDFDTNDPGVIVLDFNMNVLAQNYVNSGRTVYNLTDFSGFTDSPDGTCVETTAPPELQALLTRCLPATARQLSNDTTIIGLPNDGVEIQAWEIPLGPLGKARLAFTTKDANPILILREMILTPPNGPPIVDVLLFTNQQLTVDDPTIFVEPAVCSPQAAVGK